MRSQMLHYGLLLTIAMFVATIAQGEEGDGIGLPAFSEEREAAAVAFARKHSPELLRFVLDLKKSEPDAYEKAMREIFQKSEQLQVLREQDPEMHKLALAGWTVETRIHVLAARMIYPPDQTNQAELKRELAKVVGALVKLQIEQTDLQIRRTEAHLEKMRKQRADLADRREEIAQEQYAQLLGEIERQRGAIANEEAPEEVVRQLQATPGVPGPLAQKIRFLQQLVTRRKEQGRDLSPLGGVFDKINGHLRAGRFERAEELIEQVLGKLLESKGARR